MSNKAWSVEQTLADPHGALAAGDPEYGPAEKLLEQARLKRLGADRAVSHALTSENAADHARWTAETAEALLAGQAVPATVARHGGLDEARARRTQWAAACAIAEQRFNNAVAQASLAVCRTMLPGTRERARQLAEHLAKIQTLNEQEEAERYALDRGGVSLSTLPVASTRSFIGDLADRNSLISLWFLDVCESGLLPVTAVPAGTMRDYIAARIKEAKP